MAVRTFFNCSESLNAFIRLMNVKALYSNNTRRKPVDKEQFARQVTSLQGSLYRVAASYLRGESDRLDAVSEAITRAWEKRHTLREATLFRTWITRILIRECVNIQRKQKHSVPVEQMPETASEDEDERVTALREALERLPQRSRTMVVLHYMEGYDVRETARIMGTTKGAVCAGLARARNSLRRMIGEEMDV